MADGGGPFLVNVNAAASVDEVVKVLRLIVNHLQGSADNYTELLAVMQLLLDKVETLAKPNEIIQ